jgi:ABC-type phosphate/phosphonate transport system substrate-binding protein
MRPLRFGIAGLRSTTFVELTQRFAECLGTRLGRPIEVTISSRHEHLVQAVVLGRIDLAWMSPLAHAEACAQGATLAAVSLRRGSVTYRSAVLVRRSCPGLGELRRLRPRAAWVSPDSAAGYLYPRRWLTAVGIDEKDGFSAETFHGSFVKAARAVLDEQADVTACHTPIRRISSVQTLTRIRESLGISVEDLRVLGFSEPIPPDGMVLSPALAADEQDAVLEALLALHTLPDGAEAARALLHCDRLVKGAVT